MLTQEQIDDICENLGGALPSLWSRIEIEYGITGTQVDPDSFEERKNDFFFLVMKLLDEGKLKLAKNGDFLVGTNEEIVEIFRKSFPASDEEMISGCWFFFDECPAGAVWVFKGEGENGEDYYEWT
ncbi:DUF596 domain-containing protein [Xylella fastidiosa subsp. morus]|uniref:DUF596 domain-containing protein n=1 Tax=Xylella fastidiosa subsp. multiplex TaxID=644357 RepID=A0A9Q4MI35_XYLFS|nr:DUF596 domain-containing protein [Xylella fastidiosa]KAJ4852039.1 DUF596 domain-containing protein [Xylella fastidiosa subsp. multiplex]MBE0269311.1 DUF596 domain-containing protein [Xylella fastidiosa subsp. multiplex]MBE0275936.1 DUF596 domain-containing protein [Xylella fastidiosa subsp. multiplex]MBE0278150.1 DUF596 domain-containing protein [Xylella fastidiosa subsp. multiplex]MBE0282573.1 DUF596 domain-containing protein [Xylella fastidiosa subsp. multiplex]